MCPDCKYKIVVIFVSRIYLRYLGIGRPNIRQKHKYQLNIQPFLQFKPKIFLKFRNDSNKEIPMLSISISDFLPETATLICFTPCFHLMRNPGPAEDKSNIPMPLMRLGFHPSTLEALWDTSYGIGCRNQNLLIFFCFAILPPIPVTIHSYTT